jgi:Nucleopolyhedrovirus p26 protein
MYAQALCLLAMASAAATVETDDNTHSIYNVEYTVNNDERKVRVLSVDNKPVHVQVVPPGADTNLFNADSLDLLHHFPGVASGVVFPQVNRTEPLYVLLNDGVLLRVVPTYVYTNYHVHKNRVVYGQLATFGLQDFTIADKVFEGAPIFRDGQLVSVVSCRYDDYDLGLAMFPVTGVRPLGLMSGHINTDSEVRVQRLEAGMSVYGSRQLPYADLLASDVLSAKRFALSTNANRRSYRDMPRTVNIFHNRLEVTFTLVEGEFEIDRVRIDGPLITIVNVEN